MRGELLLKGLAFGFILAATVGPMWVLCLRRTLASGALVGLASGLGIALADGLYGAVAAFGLTAISSFLLAHAFWIGLAGSAFLLYLGVKTLIAEPKIVETEEKSISLPRRPASPRLGLTLANPPTILAFAAIVAGLGLASSADYGAAALRRRRRIGRLGRVVGSSRPRRGQAAPPARAAAVSHHQRRLGPDDPRLRGMADRRAFPVK